MILTREFLFVSIVILLSRSGRLFQYISFFVIQLIWMTWFLIVRPFEKFHMNLIESLHGIYFLFLILIFYLNNDEEKWSDSKLIVIWVLTSNTMMLCFISMCKSISLIFRILNIFLMKISKE